MFLCGLWYSYCCYGYFYCLVLSFYCCCYSYCCHCYYYCYLSMYLYFLPISAYGMSARSYMGCYRDDINYRAMSAMSTTYGPSEQNGVIQCTSYCATDRKFTNILRLHSYLDNSRGVSCCHRGGLSTSRWRSQT